MIRNYYHIFKDIKKSFKAERAFLEEKVKGISNEETHGELVKVTAL